jgi:hypothetical protein
LEPEVFKVAIQEAPVNWTNILTAVTAIGTLAAAGLMLRSNWLLKQSNRHIRISGLQEYRYSDDMRMARLALRKLYDSQKGNPTSWFIKNRDTPQGQMIDKHRRYFFSYFRRIKDMYDAKILNEEDLKVLVNSSDISMLLLIDQPIERGIHETLIEMKPKTKGSMNTENLFVFFEAYLAKQSVK